MHVLHVAEERLVEEVFNVEKIPEKGANHIAGGFCDVAHSTSFFNCIKVLKGPCFFK
jgi:hypothetical protein